MSKVISFEPRVGKAQTGQTSGGFTVIIPFNNNELDESFPSVIVFLLQEYEDMFPNDVLSGLPPIRGIEHQIDFVSGATIPNRPSYRSNPEETKELQRQVEELLTKGHVKESMSPCAVPVLLVAKKDGIWRISVDCRAINNITVTIRGRILLKRRGMMRINSTIK